MLGDYQDWAIDRRSSPGNIQSDDIKVKGAVLISGAFSSSD